MAWRQGLASISVRKGAVVIVTGSIVKGGRMDWRGIWHGLSNADFEAFHARVDWLAPDEEIGGTLRRALKATRLNIPVPATWANGLWSDTATFQRCLATAFGLSSAKNLYPGMVCCGARWAAGKVTLNPTRRRRGGEFEGFGPAWREGHEEVSLRFKSSDRELGAALRTCISRCA